jgi:outer membrane protein OmpA-like peptidoglycan-associated protein
MKPCGVLFLSMIVIVTGCSLFLRESPPPQELVEAMEQARKNFDAVKRLPVYEKYARNFQEAEGELVNAENYLQEHLYEQASRSALKSLEASQWILRQFYRDTIALSAQKAKAKITAISDEDPGNPLQEFLPEINDILDYSEGIGNDQQEINISKVLADFDKITKIEYTTQKTMKQTLESDVSFGPGEYELSDKGKHAIDAYCEAIIAGKKEFDKLYPDRTILVKIKVVGYTDQVDFVEGTNLLKQLVEGIEDELPREQPAQREFLNRRLSEFRAKIISDYIIQYISRENLGGRIEQEAIGLGEKLPPNISSPYPQQDSRRRICKIYGYVLVR